MRDRHNLSVGADGKLHPLYMLWKQMRKRCNNPAAPGYANYGGRGISVCIRWNKFANFWADMQPAYRPGLTLERKNNDLGYSPRNCVWASRKTQSRNRRATRLTAETAAAIRAEHVAGAKQVILAERYSISRAQIYNIIRGRQWL